MQDLLPLIPGFIGFFIALITRSPEKVFFWIYLPVLIFTPPIFDGQIPGLPPLGAADFAGVAALAALFFYRLNRFKPSFQDFLIFAYIASISFSEWVNTSNFLKILFGLLVNILPPYLLGKTLFSKEWIITFFKRYTFFLFIMLFICLYEWRFTNNPFNSLSYTLFTPNETQMHGAFRNEMLRLSGAFVHPILFAMAISIALFMNFWIRHSHLWKKKFSFLPALPLSKGILIELTLFLGLFMTFSRGPLAAYFMTRLIASVGFKKHPLFPFLLRCCLILFILLGGWYIQNQNKTKAVNQFTSEQDSSSIYRANLFEAYQEIAWEKPYFGWGRLKWPVIEQGFSIDNHYLFLWLEHGLVTLSLLFFLFIKTDLSLICLLLKPHCPLLVKSLAATFLSILLFISLCLIIVFMGAQIQPLTFLFFGVAEGFLKNHKKLC